MDENIKNLMAIALELESFKLKVYTLLNTSKWLDDFIMENAPCNYDLSNLIKAIRAGQMIHTVKPITEGIFKEIPCLVSEDQYAFFESEEDHRPSSCIWIDKSEAEILYELFQMNENPMTHKPEILKIIESGIEGDAPKLIAYAELLIQKCKGDIEFSQAIKDRITGEYKTKKVLHALSSDKNIDNDISGELD